MLESHSWNRPAEYVCPQTMSVRFEILKFVINIAPDIAGKDDFISRLAWQISNGTFYMLLATTLQRMSNIYKFSLFLYLRVASWS